MSNLEIVYIVISGIIALSLALFQYTYKNKSTLNITLFTLRFVSVFCVLLLIINPKFNSYTSRIVKPNLVLLKDNSQSIKILNQDESLLNFSTSISKDEDILEKFNVSEFQFGSELLKVKDSLDFTAKQSNISNALNTLKDVYRDQKTAIALLSDGNQTLGKDYIYTTKDKKHTIIPVVFGDTTKVEDLLITNINVNKYVYLKNKFPVEIISNFNGNSNINTFLKIWNNNKVVFQKKITFNKTSKSNISSILLESNKIGVSKYKVELVPFKNEKNTNNNIKNFAIETIDESSKIVIVSDITHPDIGALKKAIETNKQREVFIKTSSNFLEENTDYNLVILFQPNQNFKSVYNTLKNRNNNVLTITGSNTNHNVINDSHLNLNTEITGQTEAFSALKNETFSAFDVKNIDFSSLPPLTSELGFHNLNTQHQTLLDKSINGINTNSPLIAIWENNKNKFGVINGEGIWRWRTYTFLNTKSFTDFDIFINQIIQYLSSNKKRSRLEIDFNSFYNSNENVKISAIFRNKNYEFDKNVSPYILIKNTTTLEEKTHPLILNYNSYSTTLTNLKKGDYEFEIFNKNKKLRSKGSFSIIEYNVEQQFLNSDFKRLKLLAKNNNEELYFSNQIEALKSRLLTDEQFKPTQKSIKNVVPLLEWKYLLLIIILSLTIEWFLRKYNGLI